MVSRVPVPADFRLEAPPGADELSVAAVDGATAVNSAFRKGDYLVLSAVQSSEIVRLNEDPPATPTALLKLDPKGTPAAFGPTFGGALRGTYVKGDFVYPATLAKIGRDPATEKVLIEEVDKPSAARALATGISRFSFLYRVEGAFIPAACAPLASKDGSFSREDWNLVNSKQCYPSISELRAAIRGGVGDQSGDATFAGSVKEVTYTFKVNH